MDELEMLKNDWNAEKSSEFRNYSEEELFAMTKKKSVSIAKWVFIICVLEILFWEGLDYFFPDSDEDFSSFQSGGEILEILDIIATIVPILFLGTVIYLNYRIRVLEEPKRLMRKILMMRNAIRWYIRIFLMEICMAILVGVIWGIKEDISKGQSILLIIIMLFIFIGIIAIILLFFRFIYHVIYGGLIRRLEENYKELNEQ